MENIFLINSYYCQTLLIPTLEKTRKFMHLYKNNQNQAESQ